MGSSITKPILRRMFRLLGVSQSDNPVLELSPQVVGTYNALDVLKVAKCSVTTGTASTRVDRYTVPDGKEWHLITSYLYRGTAGEGSCDVRFTLRGVVYSQVRQIAAFTGEKELRWYYLPMQSGDSIEFTFAVGGVASIGSSILYLENDV